jgi:peptide/nickel transport system ATP-binding protein
MSMIFQEPMTALSPVHTIGNQIDEAILVHQDVSAAAARRLTLEMLHKVGIANAEQRYAQYPHELSGGMRQRAVIAMALVCRPNCSSRTSRPPRSTSPSRLKSLG